MICIEETAFFTLVEKAIECLKATEIPVADKWISGDDAMALLRIKSKTTLQKLRDEGKIRFSQPASKMVLYDRDSINDLLDDFAYETFDLK